MKTLMELADAYANETFFVGNGVSPPQKIKQLRAALEQRIKELERDAKRWQFIRQYLMTSKDMPILTGRGARPEKDETERVDEDIDRAISEAALTKAVEISQEYKLP